MLLLKGKYNSAVVYTDNVDAETQSQIINLMNQRFVQDSQVRIMPDCHAGAGCVIGTTMTLLDKVVPNLVGVDIGCGVLTAKIKCPDLNFEKLDKFIRDSIPSGCAIRGKTHVLMKKCDLTSLRCNTAVNLDRAEKSIGTLGGGNHFIEVSANRETSEVYLLIHTGSRHLGLEVAKFYQQAATAQIKGGGKVELDKVIADLKARGRAQDISAVIAKYAETNKLPPEELCYVSGDTFNAYLHDMKLCQMFAALNRQAILNDICTFMNWGCAEIFDTVHNYIDTDFKILRKGAVPAYLDQKLVIPLNMADGTLLCLGKGNPNWNFSAPHGAGRILSRSKAKSVVALSDYEKAMVGIYTTCVNMGTIDESPMAYKPAEEIVKAIVETVYIVGSLKPVYNFKASE